MSKPCIVLSTGEPAGIGPDLCLSVAASPWPVRLVAVGDASMLAERAQRLGLATRVSVVNDPTDAPEHQAGTLAVVDVPLATASSPGDLQPGNARYVLAVIDRCIDACLDGQAAAMVTAPVHKGVINDAGVAFSGHTEYLAERSRTPLPVMLLCADELRVALATTHLPLHAVSAAITPELLDGVLRVLTAGLRGRFGLDAPRIGVGGLQPHAGESGHLGREEIEVIVPTLDALRAEGLDLVGPLPADTAFTPRVLEDLDAVLAMFHDQGLPVLKYAGFGDAVNVTLGLPFPRTSVDHGTALDLAGGGEASDGSLRAALRLAVRMSAS